MPPVELPCARLVLRKIYMTEASSSSTRSKKLTEAEVGHPTIDFAAVKGDEVELWAISVPPGFDASRLEGLDVTSDTALGNGFELRGAPAIECSPILAAFPSAKKKRWLLGKPFSKQLVVSVPPPPHSAATDKLPPPLPPVPMVPGLRLRTMHLGGTLPPRASAPGASSLRKRSKDRSDVAAGGGSAEEDAEARAARKAAKKASKKAAR